MEKRGIRNRHGTSRLLNLQIRSCLFLYDTDIIRMSNVLIYLSIDP